MISDMYRVRLLSAGGILTIENDLLGDGQLRVSRSRGQVQDQDIEITPVNLVKQLLNSLHNHRAPPNHSIVLRHEISHRHGLDTIICHWHQLVI